MREYKEFKLQSKSKYKDVKGIAFKPIKEVPIIKVASKGDIKVWKFLGLIPIKKYEVKENLYKSDFWEGKLTLNAAMCYIGRAVFKNGEKLFFTAEVTISYSSSSIDDWFYFTSNEKALEFVEDLKEKCKKFGNELN